MHCQEDQNQMQEQKAEVESQARRVKLLDLSKIQHCRFLVKKFRELDTIVNKTYRYCNSYCQLPRNYYPEDQLKKQIDPKLPQFNVVDEIMWRAKILQPYVNVDLMNSQIQASPQLIQRPVVSIMSKVNFYANRQCYQPKVKLDGQIVFQYQNSLINRLKGDSNYQVRNKSKTSHLIIEVEPNCGLFLTRNGKHPLLAQSQNQRQYYLKGYDGNVQPGCIISVVAVNPEFRQPSRSTSGGEDQNFNRNEGIRRPRNDYQIQDMINSRSNTSQFNIF